MNKIIKYIVLIFVFFILTITYIFSQQLVVNEYDIFENSNEQATNIARYEDNLYVISQGICDNMNQCFSIYSLDSNNSIRWSRKFNWLNKGNYDIILVKDSTIYISSHGDFLYEYHVIKMTLEGDSLDHYNINLSDSFINGLSNDGIAIGDNEILLYGNGKNLQNQIVGFVLALDFEGNILSQAEYYDDESEWHNLAEIKYNPSSKNYFGILSSMGRPGVFRKWIVNIESDLRMTQIYELKSHFGTFDVKDNVAISENNNIVFFENYDDIQNSYPRNLVCIDVFGNVIWELKWPDIDWLSESKEYQIKNIKAVENKIIGCGIYNQYLESYNFWVSEGYIFQVSQDGNLDWERFYRYNINYDLLERELNFLDFTFGEESLHFVGRINNINTNEFNSLYLTTDKFGCVSETNCFDLISSNDNLNNIEQKINFYPNPLKDNLFISLPSSNKKIIITIFNNLGILVFEKEYNNQYELNIETNKLVPGIYHCYVNNDTKTYYHKVVKI